MGNKKQPSDERLDGSRTVRSAKERCPAPKKIYLHGFRGLREPEFMACFEAALRVHAHLGKDECLLYSGHAGISFDSPARTIFGFNPATGEDSAFAVFERLKGKGAYPGVVTDDTSAFELARQRGVEVVVKEITVTEAEYEKIRSAFAKEQAKSSHSYGFPGAGDCNCATWPAKIGLPIPSTDGNMKAYVVAMKDWTPP